MSTQGREAAAVLAGVGTAGRRADTRRDGPPPRPCPTCRFDRGTLYCSPPTALLIQQQLRVKPACIRSVPLNSPITVEGVRVTFLDANHCPGAVMILFEPPGRRPVLHTGDCRLVAAMQGEAALQAVRCGGEARLRLRLRSHSLVSLCVAPARIRTPPTAQQEPGRPDPGHHLLLTRVCLPLTTGGGLQAAGRRCGVWARQPPLPAAADAALAQHRLHARRHWPSSPRTGAALCY